MTAGSASAARAPVTPSGWDANPSSFRRRWPIVASALPGFGAATYLSLFQWGVVGSSPRPSRTSCRSPTRRWAPWVVILFGLVVDPFGAVSVLLVILRPVFVDAWCTLCLASAVISLATIGPAACSSWSSPPRAQRSRAATAAGGGAC